MIPIVLTTLALAAVVLAGCSSHEDDQAPTPGVQHRMTPVAAGSGGQAAGNAGTTRSAPKPTLQ